MKDKKTSSLSPILSAVLVGNDSEIADAIKSVLNLFGNESTPTNIDIESLAQNSAGVALLSNTIKQSSYTPGVIVFYNFHKASRDIQNELGLLINGKKESFDLSNNVLLFPTSIGIEQYKKALDDPSTYAPNPKALKEMKQAILDELKLDNSKVMFLCR